MCSQPSLVLSILEDLDIGEILTVQWWPVPGVVRQLIVVVDCLVINRKFYVRIVDGSRAVFVVN